MYRKRHRKGKLKTTPSVVQEQQVDRTDRKSQIAKKELEMMSFDWDNYPEMIHIPDLHSVIKGQEDCIRTTVNTLTDRCAFEKVQRRKIEKKRILSRYLRTEYSSRKKDEGSKAGVSIRASKLSINNISLESFGGQRIKGSSFINCFIMQKKKKLKDKVRSLKQSNLSHRIIHPSLERSGKFLKSSPTKSKNFFTFNDTFNNCTTERNSTFLTERLKDDEKEKLLRPQFIRLIYKIKNKEQRNQEKSQRLSSKD